MCKCLFACLFLHGKGWREIRYCFKVRIFSGCYGHVLRDDPSCLSGSKSVPSTPKTPTNTSAANTSLLSTLRFARASPGIYIHSKGCVHVKSANKIEMVAGKTVYRSRLNQLLLPAMATVLSMTISPMLR